MATFNRHNIISLAEEQLLSQLKPAVEENIINAMVEDFKDRVRPMVREEVEKIGKMAIHRMHDLANFRDEVKVYVEIKDE